MTCLFCEVDAPHTFHDGGEINLSYAFEGTEPPNQVSLGLEEELVFADTAYQHFAASRRHPTSQKFHDVLTGWGALHDKKQQDYGADDDPFRNVRASEDFGIPAWVGAVLRASDKMRRLEKAARQVLAGLPINMANEGVGDSFDDMGVYSGIGRVLFDEWVENNGDS